MTTPTYVDLDTIQRPSTGLVASVAWGDQVNDNFTALEAAIASTATLQLPYTFKFSGPVQVPSGATGYIGPMFVPVPTGQTATLVAVVALARSGSVTFEMTQNGTAISGLSTLTATTTSSGRVAPSETVTFADLDQLAPVVTAVSDTPDGLTITAFIAYTVSA